MDSDDEMGECIHTSFLKSFFVPCGSWNRGKFGITQSKHVFLDLKHGIFAGVGGDERVFVKVTQKSRRVNLLTNKSL